VQPFVRCAHHQHHGDLPVWLQLFDAGQRPHPCPDPGGVHQRRGDPIPVAHALALLASEAARPGDFGVAGRQTADPLLRTDKSALLAGIARDPCRVDVPGPERKESRIVKTQDLVTQLEKLDYTKSLAEFMQALPSRLVQQLYDAVNSGELDV